MSDGEQEVEAPVAEEQDDGQQEKWKKMPGDGGKPKGPPCAFILRRGKNANKPCYRGGYHDHKGKLYCLAHIRQEMTREKKLEQALNKPPRKAKKKLQIRYNEDNSPQVYDPNEEEEPADPPSDVEEQVIEQGEVHPPSKAKNVPLAGERAEKPPEARERKPPPPLPQIKKRSIPEAERVRELGSQAEEPMERPKKKVKMDLPEMEERPQQEPRHPFRDYQYMGAKKTYKNLWKGATAIATLGKRTGGTGSAMTRLGSY
jgi:hypothetical protein